MRIVHADGTWLVNKCLFPMSDPTQDVRLEPGEVTCVKVSDWLKMQMAEGLFAQVQSPMAAPQVSPQPAGKVLVVKKPVT